MSADGDDRALTDAQRAMMAKHVGLVRMHLRQRVRGLHRNICGREWDDLYQEGCVALLGAVRTWREDSGMAFSTYAIPRIKAAVHNALTEHGSLVRQPRAVMRKTAKARVRGERPKSKRPVDRRDDDSRYTGGLPEKLSFVALSPLLSAPSLHDPPLTGPGDEATGSGAYETLGDRMHGRIIWAIRSAGDEVARSSGGREDRSAIIGRLVNERLLVADEAHQVSMRELARQTDSSYARIAHCAKVVLEKAAELLERDSEARALSAAAGRFRHGWRTPITDSLGDALDADRARRFRQLMMRADAEVRAALLWRLLAKCGRQNELLLTGLFDRLKSDEKSRIVQQLEESSRVSYQTRLDPAA